MGARPAGIGYVVLETPLTGARTPSRPEDRLAKAAAWVNAATISVAPLLVHLAVVGKGVNPFWWVAALNLGQALAFIPALAATANLSGWVRRMTWSDVLGVAPGRRRWVTAPAIWMVPPRLSIAFFVWSTAWISTAAAAVVGQYLVPVATAVILILTGRSRPPSRWPALTAAAIAGVWFVAAGEAGGFNALLGQRSGGSIAVGLALAAVSTSGAALSAFFNLVHGERLASSASGGHTTSPIATAWWATASMALACFAATPLNLLIGWVTFGPAELGTLVSGFVQGLTVVAVGGAALRIANALSRDAAAINAPMLLGLPFGVLWLLLAGASPNRLDLYLIGVVTLGAVVWTTTTKVPSLRPLR